MDAEDCASIQEEPEARAPASSLKPVSQTPVPQAPVPQTLVPQTPVPQTPIQALWRLREYLRPYYRQLVVMLVAALISTGTEIAIPLLAKAAIDGPIAAAATVAIGQPHKFGVLIVIGIAAFALGGIDVLFNAVRRCIQANAVVGLEQSMRDDLYHQLQLLEPGFHDSWQSGQLLSRTTTDLSAIRRVSRFV